MNEKRYYYDILSEFDAVRNGSTTVFTPPEVKNGNGRIPYGFDYINTSAAEILGWYGFRFRFRAEKELTAVFVEVTLANKRTLIREFSLCGVGKHELDVRLEDFNEELANLSPWRELYEVRITSDAEMLSARLVRGRVIFAECDVKGRSGEIGEQLSYTVRVVNCSDREQFVSAEQVINGWESIYYEISPRSAVIPPHGDSEFTVSGMIHDYMIPGAHEKGVIRFTPSGDGSSAVSVGLYSMRAVSHPLIYHTAEEWRATAEKIAKYDKFRPEYERMKHIADTWEVPKPLPLYERDYCYNTNVEYPLVYSAYMYCLTGNEDYALKVAKFMEYYSDTDLGYPIKKKGCSQSYVQEGHFTAHIALAYDLIYNSSALTPKIRAAMEKCFRIYIEILDRHLSSSHISNWVLSELSGALYCSVVLGDYERIDRFLFGHGGIYDQLKYGVFDDGWWYECSLSYNTWVSSIALHTAHVMRHYGVDLFNASIPVTFNKEVHVSHPSRPVTTRFAMVNQRWGGIERGYIKIKDLFDAPLRFLDYRGVMFGVNDSSEKKLTGPHLGSTYDLAYHYYRDPAYLSVIKTDPHPDPIFGIGEISDDDNGTEPYRESAYSDNIGLLMLRSRTPGRDMKNEIQAVLRYGSHGYAHGHFDRTELLSLMRYGKSLYNPEHVWWGYAHFMYKFYVQSSATKNMVTVDGKMQLPSDSKRTLFFCDEKYSAGAVVTTAEWAYPPFGGMVYDTGRTLAEQVEFNASDLTSITAAPHGAVTELTEPIRQVRAMAVTADYVVIFDHVSGESEHEYDCIYQMKGFAGIDSETGAVHVCHRGQKSEDVRSDTQFITNCDYYSSESELKATFKTVFGDGEYKRGERYEFCEPGELVTDIYTAWPRKSTASVGFVAADMGIRIPYDMTICDGEREAYSHHANAWILGTRKLDVTLSGDGDVTVKINNLPVYNEQLYAHRSSQGLFLADAVIEYDDGERVRVADMAISSENIDEGYGIGRDYEGSEALITGEYYPDAIPISPVDHDKLGILKIDAHREGKRPVRLMGIVGACAFPGDKSQRRVTYGVAQKGVAASFITVIEPHEGIAAVKSVRGVDENTVTVTLSDGRRDTVRVSGIVDGTPTVTVESEQDGII